MALRIYKINKNNIIYRSKDIKELENYDLLNGKEIFRSSLLVSYFNVIDESHHYFVVHDDEELIEKIHEAKYTNHKKKKLIDIFPNKKPIIEFKYENKILSMKIKKNIEDYDLSFENFKESEKYRVVKRKRFSNNIVKSKWVSLNAANTIEKMIENKNKIGKNGRNIEICYIESLEKRTNSIYRLKNRKEEYYVLRELKLDKLLEEKIENKLYIEGIKKDKETNFNKIKSMFLIHIFKNVRIKANFKTLQKEKWGEKILLMETKIKEFDKNQFSIREQKMLLNRIFPSMVYSESHKIFFNEQRLKDNSTTYLIKNYKFNVLISIIKKAKEIGVLPNVHHYRLLDEALRNHNLKSIEKNRTMEKNSISKKKIKNPKLPKKSA